MRKVIGIIWPGAGLLALSRQPGDNNIEYPLHTERTIPPLGTTTGPDYLITERRATAL
jgi:hypothetical protein